MEAKSHNHYKELTGTEFKRHFPGPYYKVLSHDGIHHGMLYDKTGTYKDSKEFKPKGFSRSGGLYFSDKANIHRYFSNGVKIATIEISDDARVYVEHEQAKVDKFTITDITWLADYDDAYSGMLEYTNPKNHTEKMCVDAIKKDISNIYFIENPSREIQDITISELKKKNINYDCDYCDYFRYDDFEYQHSCIEYCMWKFYHDFFKTVTSLDPCAEITSIIKDYGYKDITNLILVQVKRCFENLRYVKKYNSKIYEYLAGMTIEKDSYENQIYKKYFRESSKDFHRSLRKNTGIPKYYRVRSKEIFKIGIFSK